MSPARNDKPFTLAGRTYTSRLLVGTGMNGQIFEIDESSRERSEIARLENGQVHTLLRRGGAVVTGRAEPRAHPA